MNADMLLDAFGQIDDRFVVPEEKPRRISWRRSLTVLVAAVMIAAMCIGTAMAVSEDFRSFIFSIFRIETPDQPPANEETQPTEPGLHEMDIVNIDGQVNAWYFSSGGFMAVHEGGFYTSAWREAHTAPAEPSFWEITIDGIKEVPNTRVDLPFTHGGKTFRILFDYAILNGSLAVQIWPEGLDENPIGNGWNVEPIDGRTDAALLTIPVLSGNDYTHDLFLLDLTTLKTEELIVDTIDRGVIADGYMISDNFRYGIVTGIDPGSGYGHWLYDLETDTLIKLAVDSVCFLDSKTLLLRRYAKQNTFDLVRMHIPTGIETILLEGVTSDVYRPIQNHWADGHHGLMYREDGSIDLMDFRTKELLKLTDLSTENLTCDESPDGSRIMLGYEDKDGFTSLGILDPDSGVLKLLDREVSGGSESFRGWLDNDTLVITAHDSPNAELTFTPGDGYYVYVYRFLDKELETSSPTVTEPEQTAPLELKSDDFVQVSDHIPDIVVDLRYATENNFTGEEIYDFSEAWLRYGTVKKLMQVQQELRQYGLSLKIWDGFRPTAAQFRLWEICPDSRYVANPNNGFSSHSRGGTVDVTLVYTDGTELMMPTGYDDFSTLADRNYSDCDPEAAANAKFLEEIMVKYGFKPYTAEWWHYTDTDDYHVDESFQP